MKNKQYFSISQFQQQPLLFCTGFPLTLTGALPSFLLREATVCLALIWRNRSKTCKKRIGKKKSPERPSSKMPAQHFGHSLLMFRGRWYSTNRQIAWLSQTRRLFCSPCRICCRQAASGQFRKRNDRFRSAIVWHLWTNPDRWHHRPLEKSKMTETTKPNNRVHQWFHERPDSSCSLSFWNALALHWEKKKDLEVWKWDMKSVPAVSQIWSLITLPSSSTVRILKSTPIVEI